MFWNIYGKRVISTLRDKDTLIWTWVFPLMMSTLFFFTFSSLDTEYQLKVIPIGVVADDAYKQDSTFTGVMDTVSKEGEEQLFKVYPVDSAEQADTLLDKGEICGYIQVINRNMQFTVKSDGLNQTITKSFLDNYLQTRSSIENIIAENPEAAKKIAEMFSRDTYTREISLTENPPTDKVNYFYALLAMVCMYGGFQGFLSISFLQANLSALGARRTMAPTKRLRLIVYDLLGGFTVHFCCLVVVVAYIIFVLGINFGSKLGLVLLTCLVGSLMGVAFGAAVSVTSKLKEAAKTAILIAFTMICCFLSGLMVNGINYIVAEKAPIVAWLNPAARITDAFYCLYYYDTYERYFLNIGILLAMTAVMFAWTAFFVRRQSYESI